MSNNSKITGIRLNVWGILFLALIILLFWEPILILTGSLAVGWLVYRNRDKILLFFRNLSGK